jgi:hypothetical protein
MGFFIFLTFFWFAIVLNKNFKIEFQNFGTNCKFFEKLKLNSFLKVTQHSFKVLIAK